MPLFITGKLTPDSVIAQGTAPHTVGFVEAHWTARPSSQDADRAGCTHGARPSTTPTRSASALTSSAATSPPEADILDPAFKGKTAILNISVDRHHGRRHDHGGDARHRKYADKGNMTIEEIDKTIDFLIETKQDGQFRAF